MSTNRTGASAAADLELDGVVGATPDDGADGGADVAVAPAQAPVGGDRPPTVIEDVSGIRSPSANGSALAGPAQPGPTTRTAPTSSSTELAVSAEVALRRLAADVGDIAIAEQFVTDYLRLADERVANLDRVLAAADSEAAVITLLGLESSSAMVGGRDVVAAARRLRHAVERDQGDPLGLLFDELCGTVSVLKECLPGVDLRPRSTPHPVAERPVDSRRHGRSR